MCRLVAYLGTPQPLSAVLYDPPHGLESQAYGPRLMVNGDINTDGTAVVWWGGGEAVRYATPSPPWADENLRLLAANYSAESIVAAVRTATPGIGFGIGHVQPWLVNGMAGVHNGWIEDFTGELGSALTTLLETPLEVANDALATVLLAAERSGGDPARGVQAAVGLIDRMVRAAGLRASLNVGLGNGAVFAAARHAVGVAHNSLFVREEPAATWVASEPLDQGPWTEIPESHLVVAKAGAVAVHPLELE